MNETDLAVKINTLENNHQSFISELRQTNETLKKIEVAIEKQNEIHTDLRLLRQEFNSHNSLEQESLKRQNARIEKLENNQSRIAWTILTSVILAIMGILFKG